MDEIKKEQELKTVPSTFSKKVEQLKKKKELWEVKGYMNDT